MRIRLTCERSGPSGYHLEGDVIDVDEAEGRRLILARLAETPPKPQAAAKAPSRQATRPRPRTR